ncbi:MAG: efflux RND transporter periplasmic adaptor subunit [Acidobacteria bacterium]|nr:efflux RND transporter periplasmic adaptor subunit [Acidobacteriota bacterium]
MVVSKRNKSIIAASVLLLLAAGIAYIVYARRVVLPVVQTARVERHSLLEAKVAANGEVRPIQFINLTAEVSGRVVDIFVKEGDQVVKGKPLLQVDPTQQASSTSMQEAAVKASQAGIQDQTVAITAAENTINDKQAELNTVKADLERVKVERKNAEVELKRNTELVETGIVSRSVYDTAKMRYDSACAVVESAQARVQQMQVQIRNAEIRVDQAKAALAAAEARAEQAQVSLDKESDLLSRTTQYSPINGVIANLPIQVGTFALANFISTPLMIIADMSVVNVEVRADETDVANIKVGQKAKIKVDALDEQELLGDVVEIAASAVTRSGATIASTAVAGSQEAKDFKVVIRLTNLTSETKQRLRPGMSASATITTDRRENVISIPLQALVEREQPQDKPGAVSGTKPSASQPAGTAKATKDNKVKKGVYVVQNDKAIFTPVETGITGENDIEITSGLQEQQEIILGPYRQLRSLKNESVIKREEKKPQVKD